MLAIQSKKTGHDTKVNEATPEFNKLTAENFATGLAHGNLVTKTDFENKL